MDSNNSDRLFRFPFSLPKLHGVRTVSVYLSGIFYALGFWVFLDAALYSKHSNASDVHVTFIDWIPFLCSTFGMLIVNSIEKNRLLQGALSNDGGISSSFGGVDEAMAWQARSILFFGFALLAGGLSGSIVVLIIKFLVKDYTSYPTVGMGINNVLGNIFILISCVVLWIAQNIEDEYSYSLTL
ncbi:hypothetical protein NCAS_0C04530 [Naumovozyma castellii]|uniref:Vacuolar protein sorting-associated protein 68 n=1 Tax=Naumovozyma castellii TaxID=27288 RepID=G0VD81_NAUCA|nr:hypothetical protein NCAS_0C04530 [Naumovozyma castellii CBS 4309]CCC69443.1 hypothetical protein NCAS_0C04530 [Naumovozyma castellii CBS 4309]